MKPRETIIRSASLPFIGMALVTLAGCPPQDPTAAGPARVASGDWVFEIQDILAGELGEPPVKVGVYLHENGAVSDSPTASAHFRVPVAWSQTGDAFRLRTLEFPYIVYDAVVKRSFALEGRYYDESQQNSIIGTFEARWVPAPYEGDPPDTQL